MSNADDLSPDAVAILCALLAMEAEGVPKRVTDEQLVCFACKWCPEEEEDEIMEALSEDPAARGRLVEILDEISSTPEGVQVRTSSENPSIRGFVKRALSASIQAFSSLRFPLDKPQNPDAALVLSHTLQGIGERIASMPAGFATVRGGLKSPGAAEIDTEGNLVISGVSGEETIALADPVLGNIPLTGISGDMTVAGFAQDLRLSPGAVPKGAFSVAESSAAQGIWVSHQGQDLFFPVVAGPTIVGSRLNLTIDAPHGLKGYALSMDMRAGPILIHLGTWRLNEGPVEVSITLPDVDDGPVPIAALALSLNAPAKE